MPKKLTLIFYFIFLISTSLEAQTNHVNTEKKDIKVPDIEKVYLHTDRDYYLIGESLWYKAYCVYGYTNTLFNNSKTLYVELVSPESKIVIRNITQLDEGIGHGDMILADSLDIRPGIYQLRAYTNWMRNFGNDFIFKKEINIISTGKNTNSEKQDKGLVLYEENTNYPDTKKRNIIVNFFPEGGSLIENVPSFLAFKATDQYGNPVDIEGTVFDNDANRITDFKSNHEGMGKLPITPEVGKQYYAEILTPELKKIKIEIEKAEETGYALSMNFSKGLHVINIKTNKKTLAEKPNAPLTLLCSTRGVAYYVASQPLNQKQISFLLPENELPEGIAQITLLDGDSKPQSERLIYIEKNHNLSVSIKTDKEEYQPREKISIQISAKDKQQNPLVANFSVTATDLNFSPTETENKLDISSYFLMAADIRGRINNPGYYFNIDNPNRIQHLDLLLLTQGWRDFVWKKKKELKDITDFKSEKGINISGKVEKTFSSAGKENSLIRMILMKKENFIMLSDTTNAEGQFKFENMNFTGKANLFLNVQNEKGKNSGHLYLDSLYNKPPAVFFNKPTINHSEKNNIDRMKENINQRNIFFNIPEENRLDDVIIKAKQKKPEEPSRFGFADYTFVPDDKGPHFSNIFIYIQFSIPNMITEGNSIRFNRYSSPPIILVDGVETEMEILAGMTTDDIAKIEAIKTSRAAVFGTKGANGALLIYTKEGKGAAIKRVSYSITKLVEGYQESRFFYSPNYQDISSFEDKSPDIRNTLYWNPYIIPDKNGDAEFSFYNNDVNTEVAIKLEGLTGDGIPVVVSQKYLIKK